MAKRIPAAKPAAPKAQLDPDTAHDALGRNAYVQVGSGDLTRDINRDLVLERIRALQPISRVDLARATGLQPSTISSLAEQLLKERWIRESALVKTARGRWPTLLSLNDDLVILAADIRPNHAIVALIDLNGRFLERQVVPIANSAEKGVTSIATVMKSFRDANPRRTLEGVGVSLPGRVDPDTGQILISPNLHWQGFDLQAALSRELDFKVDMENAANACLLSELWFGRMDGIRNAVLVTVSEGVGAAILAEGRIISGQHGLAGEFGHVCVDPRGPECGCGKRGCWEMFASSRAALRYYKELKKGGDSISILEVVGLAMDGDPEAIEALRLQAVAIGQGLHIINATLSPDLILFAGDIATFWDLSKDIIEQECKAGVMAGPGPILRSIGDGQAGRLRGAAAVVLQRHSGYYRAAAKRPVPAAAV